jgi:hypothetical protein
MYWGSQLLILRYLLILQPKSFPRQYSKILSSLVSSNTHPPLPHLSLVDVWKIFMFLFKTEGGDGEVGWVGVGGEGICQSCRCRGLSL